MYTTEADTRGKGNTCRTHTLAIFLLMISQSTHNSLCTEKFSLYIMCQNPNYIQRSVCLSFLFRIIFILYVYVYVRRGIYYLSTAEKFLYRNSASNKIPAKNLQNNACAKLYLNRT